MENSKINATPLCSSKNRVIKVNRHTPAAKWNVNILRLLSAGIERDPEADITTLLPPRYLAKLNSLKAPGKVQFLSVLFLESFSRQPLLIILGRSATKAKKASFPNHDIRSRLSPADACTILRGLSPDLRDVLGYGQGDDPSEASLSKALVDVLDNSEVQYESAWAASVMVFRIDKNLVAKVAAAEEFAITEYESLAYLQEQLPQFPAPRPHGVVRLGEHTTFLLSSFVRGTTLEKVWSQLDDAQKRTLSGQIDTLFGELRLALPLPENQPLGSVDGEGCRDLRRTCRSSSQPIMNAKQFEDWIFDGSKMTSPIYRNLLRDLLREAGSERCVFTHGDIRPANIMVDMEDGVWRVVAVIDWGSSGFYPEWWESVKMTNNLVPNERFDWYRYLPESLCQRRYTVPWLVDRIWDGSMTNA